MEPTAESVDAYTDLIQNAPANGVLMRFFAACTPGYYNREGKAASAADLFAGNRYGDGPMAFYEMLARWRQAQSLDGLRIG